MLNKIWFALLLIGIVYGFGRSLWIDPQKATGASSGKVESAQTTPVESRPPTRSDAVIASGKALTNAAIAAAKTSVELCITLIGIMAFWLGFMKIAEQAGLIQLLSRALTPLLGWLFPEVPRGHAAGGAMIMNLAANILGLGNAATPLGLKAMKELQSLNPEPETATNSMSLFLALNTSGLTLIPFSIIAWRASTGSSDPASPVVPILLATMCATVAAVVACRVLQRFYPSGSGSAGAGPATGGGR